ncbi:MAG: PDZ domain-containing protein, partial [Clostridia bacterium]|nr:PDZ domain-containing protein [Clostridia bacterium]
MKKTFRVIVSVITIVASLSLNMFAVSAQTTQTQEEQMTADYAQTIVNTAIAIVKSNYKFDIYTEDLYKNALTQIIKEHHDVWESAFRGIFNNLDMHSTYFDKDDFQKFFENISGEFSGIGVTIMEFEEGLLVSQIYANSPAEKAGLMVGDLIVSANGTSIIGLPFEEA